MSVGCDARPDASTKRDALRSATHVATPGALAAAIATLDDGGQIVIAADGDYGSLEIVGRAFADPVRIRVASGVQARFESVRVTDSARVTIEGVVVRPPSKHAAVRIEGGHDIVLRQADVGFADHAVGWSASDWNTRVSVGVEVIDTPNVVLHRNVIHHVSNGVESNGRATDVNRNTINYFSDDGVRVHGDDSKVRSNLITNNVKVDGSTNVGVQSVSRGPSGEAGGGRIDGLLVWGNTILETTDPGKPFGAPLQGIGFFDGIYGGLFVAQNLVSVDSWRGIAVQGTDGANVQYNTVVDSDPSSSRRPDVSIDRHKDGRAPIASRLRFNLAARVESDPAVVQHDNIITAGSDHATFFEDHENFDFMPTAAVPSKRGSWRHRALEGTLREAARRHGVIAGGGLASFMCNPASTDALCDLASEEYDLIVPNNALTWSAIRPNEATFDFSRGDAQIGFAERNGQVVHGHTLLWSAFNPAWLEAYRGDGEALAALMDTHVQTVVGHYRDAFPGVVTRWDVVNEPLTSSGAFRSDSIWAAVDAADGPAAYIERAFHAAHAADPDAQLLINDFGVEFGPKGDALFALVDQLKADGVPIHGVGFQSHYDTSWTSVPTQAQISAMMQRYADIGIDVHITELDVRTPTPVTAAERELADSFYQRLASACFTAPNCTTLTSWAISSANSWISTLPGYAPYHAFDDDLRPERAYWILRAGQ
ncbi:MAG: endo-1,4-beta-xylanase [Myxococcota bacterium]